jgi:tRNA G18 (ribose-2'-O)-methylase SpoU
VFERRRDDVLRVVHTRAVRGAVGELARWAGGRGIPCIEAGDAELDHFAGTAHHEGLCVEARARRWTPANELAEMLVGSRSPAAARSSPPSPGAGTAVALDRVRNPYNVGAILRSSGFFGLDGAILGAPAPHPGLATTAVRVAEGAVEHLRMARTTDLADTLARMRARGICVLGADAHAEIDARDFAFRRPTVLVVGHEREGLAERVRAQCDALLAIRGSGRVDSLNVAVAAGVLLGALVHGLRSAPRA